MADQIFNLLGTIAAIGLITTLVLPGRQTAAIAKAGFGGLSQFEASAITGKA